MGDNSEGEDKAKTLFFHHMRKRIFHNDALDEIREERKKDGNRAKADGIKLEDLDFGIKAMQMEDQQIPATTFQTQGRILDWLGIIPGFQGDLLRDRMPAMERIEAQGERAGLLNQARESGFAKNGNEDVAWLKGFDAGLAMFNKNIEAALSEADARAKAGATLIKKGKKTPPSAAEPIKGDKPPEAKAAAKPAKPPAKPSKAEKAGDDGKTIAQREAQRQAEAAFKH